jgi:succinate-semialdehyde dehydrogenase/glutarate-semialdehyde dehydrogenase
MEANSAGVECRSHLSAAKSVRIALMAATAIPINTLPSINPATGEVLAHFERTPASLLPEIVSHARVAHGVWRMLSVRDRRAKLRVLRDRMMASRNELADAVVRESGKPRVEALFADIFVALDSAEYWSRNAANALRTRRVPHHSTAARAKRGYLTYDPLGVIAIISSWNYPLAIPLSQIIPAIAAGNAVVCKTSDFTPQCGVLIEKLFIDAGFPKDLVKIVQGGGEVGQALIDASPDKVMFTGSVATGRRVAEACAKKLIPSVLELGGKDAMIVLADANLEVASSAAVWGSYTNCGQVCLSVERLFVEQPAAEKFIALCVEKTKKLRIGPGNDPATDVGPLIRPQHVRRMIDLVDDAVSRGASVLCGGNARPNLGPNFFEPTVIAGVDSSMKLFQEETFGPILAIKVVKDAKEAIDQANDSPFALAASVWTKNQTRGMALAVELHAGAVMVNDAISYFGIAEAPHGGCGASGWGRTHGKAGLLEMVQMKYIDVDGLPRSEKPWWYRYGADLERAADAFLQFEFSRGISAKLRNARGAMKTFFRDHGL